MELDKFYINFRDSYYPIIPNTIDSSEVCPLNEEWKRAILAKKLLKKILCKDIVDEIFFYLFKPPLVTSKYILPPDEDSLSSFEKGYSADSTTSKEDDCQALRAWSKCFDHEEFATEPFLTRSPNIWSMVHGVLSKTKPSVTLNYFDLILEPCVKVGEMTYYRFSVPIYKRLLHYMFLEGDKNLIYVVSDDTVEPIPFKSNIFYRNLINGIVMSLSTSSGTLIINFP